jgi:hypothetical protein
MRSASLHPDQCGSMISGFRQDIKGGADGKSFDLPLVDPCGLSVAVPFPHHQDHTKGGLQWLVVPAAFHRARQPDHALDICVRSLAEP